MAKADRTIPGYFGPRTNPNFSKRPKKIGKKNLKPVDNKKNPGLAKLPQGVRNKMGYMKDGGVVRGKARGGGAATKGLGYNVRPN
tara:strand:+ start:1835 stop:2089 length:255 start_codon:yes stop_codon:yes gene_type:complete